MRMAMIAITTSNSISVNAVGDGDRWRMKTSEKNSFARRASGNGIDSRRTLPGKAKALVRAQSSGRRSC